MYALLTRYEVRLPKDELDAVSDLRYSWRKLNKQALDVSHTLGKMQVRSESTGSCGCLRGQHYLNFQHEVPACACACVCVMHACI